MSTATADVRALGDWRHAGGGALADRLADALEAALLDGRLPLSVPLPSERTLAASAGVSRTTVTEAYATLRARGWLETRQGARGRPVLPPALDEGLTPRDGTPPGGEVIDLTIAGPAAPASAYLDGIDRAQRRLGTHLATTGLVYEGLPELRARIAARHTGAGLPTAPEEILVTSGAMAGLQLVCASLAAVRAPALAELPSYPGALDALRDRGRPLVGWPRGDAWDVERFRALVRERGVRLAYLIPDFHNPTGHSAGAAEREELAAAARELGVLVIADETMRELDLRDPPRPELPLAAHGGQVITLGSFSKVLWGGLHVGWVRAPAATIEQLARHPLASAVAAPPLEQLIALELVGELGELTAMRRRALRVRRDHLLAALARLPGISADVPAGGLSVWATLERESSTLLVARAAEAGVRLLPGGRFSPDAPLDRHLRIPFALPAPLLDRAVQRLADLI